MSAEFIPLAHRQAIEEEHKLYQSLLEKKDKYERNYTAGIIAYTKNEENNDIYVLVIEQNTTGYDDNHYGKKRGKVIYSFPKGGNDDDDTSILQTAKREFIEETGYTQVLSISRTTLDNGLFTVKCKSKNNRQTFYFYTFFIPFEKITTAFLNIKNAEIIGKKWIKIDVLNEMIQKYPGICTSSVKCINIKELLSHLTFQSSAAWTEKSKLSFGSVARRKSVRKSVRKSLRKSMRKRKSVRKR
jgi:8-oxo-dGTP pyrophosphatase MutT (NUDIX family)